jgi:hypothetical protein
MLFDIVPKIYIFAEQHSFVKFVARFASKELDYLDQSSQVLQLFLLVLKFKSLSS